MLFVDGRILRHLVVRLYRVCAQFVVVQQKEMAAIGRIELGVKELRCLGILDLHFRIRVFQGFALLEIVELQTVVGCATHQH